MVSIQTRPDQTIRSLWSFRFFVFLFRVSLSSFFPFFIFHASSRISAGLSPLSLRHSFFSFFSSLESPFSLPPPLFSSSSFKKKENRKIDVSLVLFDRSPFHFPVAPFFFWLSFAPSSSVPLYSFQVFHLHCVRKWARKSADAGDDWRCPGCQGLSRTYPKEYSCFCGQMIDPPFDVRSTSVPHTCGELCARPLLHPATRTPCGHSCSSPCHPGPCGSCMRPVKQQCFCGAAARQVPCSSKLLYSCENICDRLLNCGRHRCTTVCHEGPCGDCALQVEQTCYCGAASRTALCGSGQQDEIQGEHSGAFGCQQPCGRELDCEQHCCAQPCHPGGCGSCPRLPTAVRSCPCGQTPLFRLRSTPRTSCLDPIPTCLQICGQPLPCGDPCPLPCHHGPHGACSRKVQVVCRCGSERKTVACAELSAGTLPEFLCETVCGRLQSCRRHRCKQPCCPLRQIKDPEAHPCTLTCNKTLRCGDRCTEPCHRGHCPPCLNTLFEPLACACGKTVLPAPLPCGTPAPACSYPCMRLRPCGHPPKHSCHSADVACSPCAVLVERECSGGHGLLNTVACFQQTVSCGKVCGRVLACGVHSCPESCHAGGCQDVISPVPAIKVVSRPSDAFWGNDEDDEQDKMGSAGTITRAVQGAVVVGKAEPRPSCRLACGQLRPCGHACVAPCHPGTPCPMVVCQETVLLKCSCGHRAVRTTCRFGEDGAAAMPGSRHYGGLRLTGGSLAKVKTGSELSKPGQRVAPCDQSCEQLLAAKALEARNRALAGALAIDTSDFSADLHEEYSEFLVTTGRLRLDLVRQLEETYRVFVLTSSARQKILPTMKSDDRRLCHELAEHYGLKSESLDAEPHRSVAIFRSDWDRPKIPKPLLSEVLLQRGKPLSA